MEKTKDIESNPQGSTPPAVPNETSFTRLYGTNKSVSSLLENARVGPLFSLPSTSQGVNLSTEKEIVENETHFKIQHPPIKRDEVGVSTTSSSSRVLLNSGGKLSFGSSSRNSEELVDQTNVSIRGTFAPKIDSTEENLYFNSSKYIIDTSMPPPQSRCLSTVDNNQKRLSVEINGNEHDILSGSLSSVELDESENTLLSKIDDSIDISISECEVSSLIVPTSLHHDSEIQSVSATIVGHNDIIASSEEIQKENLITLDSSDSSIATVSHEESQYSSVDESTSNNDMVGLRYPEKSSMTRTSETTQTEQPSLLSGVGKETTTETLQKKYEELASLVPEIEKTTELRLMRLRELVHEGSRTQKDIALAIQQMVTRIQLDPVADELQSVLDASDAIIERFLVPVSSVLST